MTTNYVLSLADSQATLATAGGKGASLARLSAAGLPVPGGFHVTTAAYRRFVDDNAIQLGIPAVIGTGVATKRIRSGQVITVDGGAGDRHTGLSKAPCGEWSKKTGVSERLLHEPPRTAMINTQGFNSTTNRRQVALLALTWLRFSTA